MMETLFNRESDWQWQRMCDLVEGMPCRFYSVSQFYRHIDCNSIIQTIHSSHFDSLLIRMIFNWSTLSWCSGQKRQRLYRKFFLVDFELSYWKEWMGAFLCWILRISGLFQSYRNFYSPSIKECFIWGKSHLMGSVSPIQPVIFNHDWEIDQYSDCHIIILLKRNEITKKNGRIDWHHNAHSFFWIDWHHK